MPDGPAKGDANVKGRELDNLQDVLLLASVPAFTGRLLRSDKSNVCWCHAFAARVQKINATQHHHESMPSIAGGMLSR
jgi:hypothetical protein